MTLQIGTVLKDRYRILDVLGQGGFGAVYRAADMTLKRPCAVKENLDTSEDAQRQFEKEAVILADLSHSHLPRVIDHFIIPDQGQYLVMDYVEGENLQSILEKNGPIPHDQAVEWISQIASAIAYLHAQNPPIIHRDIKPANIRITPDGEAMLVDFGLAKIYDPRSRTTMGARAVTPGYSPPEQYGQGNTNRTTDIYSLGATLYTLLTGLEPQESVQRVIEDQVEPAHHVKQDIPPAVSQAIERAMDLRPSRRYTTVIDFKRALGLRDTTMIKKSYSQPSDSPNPTAKIPKWVYRIGIGLVILISVACVGVILLGWKAIDTTRDNDATQIAIAVAETRIAINTPILPTLSLSLAPTIESPSPTPSPHPTNTPTPSPVPTRITPTLPPKVSAILSNPRIIFFDGFDQYTQGKHWAVYKDVKRLGESWRFEDSPSYKTLLVRQEKLEPGEGTLLRFKLMHDSKALIILSSGKWQTSDYRRWGAYCATVGRMEPSIYQGKERFKGTRFKGEQRLQPDTWYYILLAVDGNADFITYIWEDANSSAQLYYTRDLDKPKWTTRQWEFIIVNAELEQGSLLLDSYMEITFTDIK